MRHFLLVILLILPGLAQAAQRSKPITKDECNILLESNVGLYGNFRCEAVDTRGGTCGTLNTFRPDDKGRVRCWACAKPHRDEPFLPPLTREAGGQTYVMAESVIVEGKDPFDLSFRIECPGCRASNLGIKPDTGGESPSACAECGHSLEGAKKLVEIEGEKHLIAMDEYVANMLNQDVVDQNAAFRILQRLRKTMLDMRGHGVGITVEEIDKAIYDRLKSWALSQDGLDTARMMEQIKGSSPATQGYASGNTSPWFNDLKAPVVDKKGQKLQATRVQQWISDRRKVLLGIGGAAALLSSLVAIEHGYQPVVYEGVVRSLNGTDVVVSYGEGELRLKRPATEIQVNDQVWIHARRWFGKPQGVEFESGGVGVPD